MRTNSNIRSVNCSRGGSNKGKFLVEVMIKSNQCVFSMTLTSLSIFLWESGYYIAVINNSICVSKFRTSVVLLMCHQFTGFSGNFLTGIWCLLYIIPLHLDIIYFTGSSLSLATFTIIFLPPLVNPLLQDIVSYPHNFHKNMT